MGFADILTVPAWAILPTVVSHIFQNANKLSSCVDTEEVSSHLLHYDSAKYFTEIYLSFTEDKQSKKKKREQQK